MSLDAKLNFNAQHSPMGAFMSFTCGNFGSGGGIGVELGKPASQNLFIGVKQGVARSSEVIRCLPFFKGSAAAAAQQAVENYQVQPEAPAPQRDSIEPYTADQVRRSYGWATDCWQTPDFKFTILTPFSPIPKPETDFEPTKAALLPAVLATLEVDNRQGKTVKTAVFAIDFVEPGARTLQGEPLPGGAKRIGFAWRRSMGVLGNVVADSVQGDSKFFAIQRWSVAEGLADSNPVHALGTCAGLAMEVPPGEKKTLVLAIGVYLDGVVTTGLEGRYFYTRYYSGLDDVLSTALDRWPDLRAAAARLDAQLLESGLSSDQQFLIAHGTRGYYGNTQLLDIGGEPFWIVNEGEYCMLNTLDLAVDQVFWELKYNPWVVANILNNFTRRYSYEDEVKARGSERVHGGVSFCHDMGINNNFSPPGHSSYELPHLKGCFSYMTQEELCNWVLMAVCYVTATRDVAWLLANKHLLDGCAASMKARANPRTGLMTHDSARCADGQEITTYDSLDESLGQARASTYLAAKCWATWIGLDLLQRLRAAAGDPSASPQDSLADQLANLLTHCVIDEKIPAVLEKENPGYASRCLPVIESLIYPAYWLHWLADWSPEAAGDCQDFLRSSLQGSFIDTLRLHALRLLTDPQTQNLSSDGGIKLSSTSDNTWISKIAIVQHVARTMLRLEDIDPRIMEIFRVADTAHVQWQTTGSSYWACSDQFVKGEAKGSRYYPRIVTAALWLDEAGVRLPADAPSQRRPQQAIKTIR
jgi:xylan 1,4-beta-xylosidase